MGYVSQGTLHDLIYLVFMFITVLAYIVQVAEFVDALYGFWYTGYCLSIAD